VSGGTPHRSTLCRVQVLWPKSSRSERRP